MIILLILISLYSFVSEITYTKFVQGVLNLNKKGFTSYMKLIIVVGFAMLLMSIMYLAILDDHQKKYKAACVSFSKKLSYILVVLIAVRFSPLPLVELTLSSVVIGYLLLIISFYVIISFVASMILLLYALMNSCRYKT